MALPFVPPVIGGILSLIAGVVVGIWSILIGQRLLMLAQGISKEEAKQPTLPYSTTFPCT